MKKNHVGDRHDNPENVALVKLGDATRMLAEIRDAPSAKQVMDLSAAAEEFESDLDAVAHVIAVARRGR